MSYATYVSATIHVRIAAQREPNSDAHACLATCLKVLKANQETNWAVKKASMVIQNLMTRMKVEIADIQAQAEAPVDPAITNPGMRMDTDRDADEAQDMMRNNFRQDGDWPGLDIDAIIQSFMREQQNAPRLADGSPTLRRAVHDHGGGGPASLPPITSHLGQGQDQTTGPYYTGYTIDTYGSPFMGHSENDMLFGFNGSAVDMGGWTGDGETYMPQSYPGGY